MKKILPPLIYYYGMLQGFHLFVTFLVIFIDPTGFIGLIHPSMPAEPFELLLTSAYIDFFVASPTGIWFYRAYSKGKKWAGTLGMFSLSTAFGTAALYLYALIRYSLWELSVVNVAIHILFAPVILLFALMLYTRLRD